MRTEGRTEVRVLKCPACGARIEVPNSCVYCGSRLVIEEMDRDKKLRDLEMETEVFLRLKELGELVGIEIKFAMEPRDGLRFAYFAMRVGAGKKDWRKVGSLGYIRTGDAVEYELRAETKEEAAQVCHWLRLRSFGLPDNTRFYECTNDNVDFLDASLDIGDIRGQRRNPVWLILVQMLNGVDPSAGKKLKEIAVGFEKKDGETEEGDSLEVVLIEVREKADQQLGVLKEYRRGWEFGDDPHMTREMIGLAKFFLERLDFSVRSIRNLDTLGLKRAGASLKLRSMVGEFLSWLLQVEERWYGTNKNAKELVNRLREIRAVSNVALEDLGMGGEVVNIVVQK